MPMFKWEGRLRGGEIRRGTLEAETEAEIKARLTGQGITPTRIVRKTPFRLVFGGKPNQREIAIFTRQLSTMIDAGLPIVQSLSILADQAERKSWQKLLREVKNNVEQGATFSEALRRQPRAFNELFTNLVAAGEAGGILDRILGRLAGYVEKSMKLRSQIRGAMVYPIAILVIAVLVIAVMLWKVIPVFEGMFKEFGAAGASLPKPTRVVIDLSHGFVNNLPIIFGAGVVLFFAIGYVLANPTGRRYFDAVILHTPLFGPLLRKVAVARFCRTLGTLLTAGVPILDALEIVAKSAGNMIVTESIMRARQRISEGRNIAEPLAESKVFPSMVVQMIAVGEQTGAMDTMLQKIADFYEDEVDVAVGSLTKLMEPAMMVFLGGIVGGMLVAMYMPIFELAGNIRGG